MNGHVFLTFHGTLNDFLPSRDRLRPFPYVISGSPSVKDSIEACGVPHPEVGLILVQGKPVDFTYRTEPGHRVSVYPPYHHPPFPETCLLPIRPKGPTTFMIDVHLGMLARLLRMLGLDCRYESEDPGDARIAAISRGEKRIVLTRDIGLLKRSAIKYGHWLRSQSSKVQLVEVVTHYRLKWECRPFSRCMQCNHLLEPVARQKVADRLPPRVLVEQKDFSHCRGCKRIYWKGSHYLNMKALVDDLWRRDETPRMKRYQRAWRNSEF